MNKMLNLRSKPMKLAFCLFKYFPYSGLARDFLRVVQECKKRGHSIHIYVSDWEGDLPDGLTINVLKSCSLMNHTQNASFYRQFRKKVVDESFDAVIGFNKMPGLDIYYGADYCYIARAVPRYGALYKITPRYYNFSSFERAVFDARSHTTILSISQREKGLYQQHYRTPENRFQLLPPTLDESRQLQQPAEIVKKEKRAELGLANDEFLLLFIGSGFKTKGLDRAINALDSLPEPIKSKTQLYVVGQDNDHVFQRLVQRLLLSEKVKFVGGREDILELMTAGDLLIHPAYSETAGTVLLEAIAAGLPVLATDVCGYAMHIVEADAGVVINSPFEQKQLNDQLMEMLRSPGNRMRWSRNGCAYGKNPVLYKMPDTAADLIENWVAEKPQFATKSLEREVDHPSVYIRPNVQPDLDGHSQFSQIMALPGEEVRIAPGRRTVKFSLGGNPYYLKTHTGVGWAEIIKNLIYFRLPVLGATNEWHGLHHLNRLGIKTLTAAAFGTTGGNPAKRRSFILTDDITDTISLEELCLDWKKHPPVTVEEIRFKRWLIHQVAEISRKMHNSGANHRDFYLCHFLLKRKYKDGAIDTDRCELFLIDLHRMQLRRKTPVRWVVKDIAGLYFSSMDIGLTTRDLFRFMQLYRSSSLRDALLNDTLFWHRVRSRGKNLYLSEKERILKKGKN